MWEIPPSKRLPDRQRSSRAMSGTLLASLLHALEEYKRGLRENVSCLDCLRGELYGSINACQRNRSITRQEAEYLREKYL